MISVSMTKTQPEESQINDTPEVCYCILTQYPTILRLVHTSQRQGPLHHNQHKTNTRKKEETSKTVTMPPTKKNRTKQRKEKRVQEAKEMIAEHQKNLVCRFYKKIHPGCNIRIKMRLLDTFCTII